MISYIWPINQHGGEDRISRCVGNQNDVTQIRSGLRNGNDVLLVETRVDVSGDVTSTKLTTTQRSSTVQNAGAWP